MTNTLSHSLWEENCLEIWSCTESLDSGKKFVQLVKKLWKSMRIGWLDWHRVYESLYFILEDALRDQVCGVTHPVQLLSSVTPIPQWAQRWWPWWRDWRLFLYPIIRASSCQGLRSSCHRSVSHWPWAERDIESLIFDLAPFFGWTRQLPEPELPERIKIKDTQLTLNFRLTLSYCWV